MNASVVQIGDVQQYATQNVERQTKKRESCMYKVQLHVDTYRVHAVCVWSTPLVDQMPPPPPPAPSQAARHQQWPTAAADAAMPPQPARRQHAIGVGAQLRHLLREGGRPARGRRCTRDGWRGAAHRGRRGRGGCHRGPQWGTHDLPIPVFGMMMLVLYDKYMAPSKTIKTLKTLSKTPKTLSKHQKHYQTTKNTIKTPKTINHPQPARLKGLVPGAPPQVAPAQTLPPCHAAPLGRPPQQTPWAPPGLAEGPGRGPAQQE